MAWPETAGKPNLSKGAPFTPFGLRECERRGHGDASRIVNAVARSPEAIRLRIAWIDDLQMPPGRKPHEMALLAVPCLQRSIACGFWRGRVYYSVASLPRAPGRANLWRTVRFNPQAVAGLV